MTITAQTMIVTCETNAKIICYEKISAPSARRSRSSSMNNSTVEVARGNNIFCCPSVSEYQCVQRTENIQDNVEK